MPRPGQGRDHSLDLLREGHQPHGILLLQHEVSQGGARVAPQSNLLQPLEA